MIHDANEKKLSDMIAVAMGSVANTGSALKIISDLQAKNDALAHQNMMMALSINSIKNGLSKICKEMEREYPEEIYITAKLKKIGNSREVKCANSTVNTFSECVQAMRSFAGSVPATPKNLEAWHVFLNSLKDLGINHEIKGPLSSKSNGSNPVPSHKCS
jgi:hypothetical protein